MLNKNSQSNFKEKKNFSPFHPEPIIIFSVLLSTPGTTTSHPVLDVITVGFSD